MAKQGGTEGEMLFCQNEEIIKQLLGSFACKITNKDDESSDFSEKEFENIHAQLS